MTRDTAAAEPLIPSHLDADDDDDEDDVVVFDAEEEAQAAAKVRGKGKGKARDVGEWIPYAHRDVKPGNIMIADDGSPILMDFGSTLK